MFRCGVHCKSVILVVGRGFRHGFTVILVVGLGFQHGVHCIWGGFQLGEKKKKNKNYLIIF